MKKPKHNRGSSVKDAIADFLKSQHCGEATQAFLQRLIDHSDDVDSIWRGLIDSGHQDSVEQRAAFIRILVKVWENSFAAIALPLLFKVERLMERKVTAIEKTIADIATDKKASRKDKLSAAKAMEALALMEKSESVREMMAREKIPTWVDIRSDRDGTRQRTAFIREAARFFRGVTADWHDKWNVDIVFRNEPGCRVPLEGMVFVDEKTGKILRDEHGNPRQGNFLYLRLKIENRGKTFAKNAAVCVTEIKYEAAGTGRKSFAEEVFDLKLAPTELDRLVFNLAAGGHRFMDLVHTVLDDEAKLKFDFGPGTHRLVPLNLGPGNYVVTVFASAENAKSIKRDLHWSYAKTWDSLKIDRPLPTDG